MIHPLIYPPTHQTLHKRLPGPHVDAGHLEPVVPRSRVCTLTLGAGAHTVPMRLAVFPAATVRATVVEVKPATVDQYLVSSGRPGGRRRRGWVAGQLLLLVVLLQQHLLLLLVQLLLLLLLLRWAVSVWRCRRVCRRHAARLHNVDETTTVGYAPLFAGQLNINNAETVPVTTSRFILSVSVTVSPPPPLNDREFSSPPRTDLRGSLTTAIVFSIMFHRRFFGFTFRQYLQHTRLINLIMSLLGSSD